MRHCLIFILILSLLSPAIGAVEYHVDRTRDNQVSFLSRSSLKDFDVRTSKIDGYVYWEGDTFPPEGSQLEESKLYFEVQLNTLDAGNSMYNNHLKEKYLETKKYPYATFEGKPTKFEHNSDSTYTVYIKGIFTIHGVPNEIEIVGMIERAGDGLKIASEFRVMMSDHEISVPKLLFLSADENIDVTLHFYLKPIQ
jgi:polyisoprenoid-binding protein YceI